MISQQNIAGLIGIDVADPEGHKIGTVGQVYVDPATGRPNWATVRTGLFGTSESFVPLEQAEEADRQLRIPYTKDFVKHAPRIGGDESLSDAEQERLYDYYRTRESTDDERDRSDEDLPRTATEAESEPARSEDQVPEGTQHREPGGARLRKYVVTEEVTVTVPISHEEIRLEREPLTESNVDSAEDERSLSEEGRRSDEQR